MQDGIIGSRSCPQAGFGVFGVEASVYVTNVAIIVSQYEDYKFFNYLSSIIPTWRSCEILRVKQHDSYNAFSSKMCLLMYAFPLITLLEFILILSFHLHLSLSISLPFRFSC
jgi:hypothetical protein